MATDVATIRAAKRMRRKAALESKLKELLDVSRRREELRIEHLADPIDQLTSSAEREVAVQQLAHQTRLIHEIELALAKIAASTYGNCERCEEPIPRKRLDAVPWARLCGPCQSQAEAAGHDGMASFEDAA